MLNYGNNTTFYSKKGFIISDPTAKVSSVNNYKSTDKHEFCKRNRDLIVNKTKIAFEEYTQTADNLNKRFFKALISFSVAILCVLFFFKYFTIGMVVFSGGKHIASASSAQAYEEALGIAKKRSADSISIDKLKYNVFPALILRSKATPPAEVSNKILLTMPEFQSAYTLYSEGEPIYTASSKTDAEKVLLSYVKEYSMNGDAEITSNIIIKKNVLKKEEIMEYDSCLKALKESNAVNVVSVVNSTVEEALPYPTKTQTDETMYIGERITVTKGITGKKEISTQTTYKNGSAQSSKIHSEKIVIEPVSEVVKIGVKEKNILESGVIWPLSKKGIISSRFGKRWGHNHEGIDIAVERGTEVLAAECGTVSYVSENAGGYGKYIKIDHGNNLQTAYAHLDMIEVKEGQMVRAGERIALSGNTGRSTGPHLHFEIVQSGNQIDPEPYMK